MVYADLQEAVERLSTDENFRNKLANNPDALEIDYGLDEKGMLALRSVNPIGIQKEELRPVAACCTCLVD